jgi:pyrimidine 5'-nucleotidase
VLIDEKERFTDFTKTSGIPSIKSIYELPALLENCYVISRR